MIENDIEECARECMELLECNSFEYNNRRCMLHREPDTNGDPHDDYIFCSKDGTRSFIKATVG